MKIIIGGDVVPTENNRELFESEDFINKLDLKFKELWNKADYRVFNLECPLGNNNYIKQVKAGPNLIASEKCINGIKSLKPDLVCLANNHILDYLQEGLETVEHLLSQNNIKYIGIIEDINQKSDTFYIEKDGVTIGIYNLCENEFSVATINCKGANPYNEFKTYRELQESKSNCDYLIVIYHGGKEKYRYPSPKLKKRCETFIDFGADIVLCQHSHSIGCEEKYSGGTILFGQGNFIFNDVNNDNEYWNTGLLVEINANKEEYSMSYIPIERFENTFKMSTDDSILKNFEERSNSLKDDGFVESSYDKFCASLIDNYLESISYHSKLEGLYWRIFKRFPKRKYKESTYLNLLNSIRCEAHSEALIKGLEQKLKEF